MHVPVTILDDFFDNPDAIRDFALAQEYFDTDGRWPGKRTKLLNEIDPDLFHHFCGKVIRLFYPDADFSFLCRSFFQKIPKGLGPGWVHVDETIITAIVYLNQNENLGSGTSIYRVKSNVVAPKVKHNDAKTALYTNKCAFDAVSSFAEDNNNQFEETIRISNVYNRLIAFDSFLWHGAQDLDVAGEDERLTLVSFFSKVDSLGPVRRSKQMS